MKLNKEILKQIIRESLGEEQAPAPAASATDARQQKVDAATTSGGLMDVEQYATMLKRVLLSPKVSPQARKQALEAIFGPKGAAINTIVLQMLKGAQE